MSLKSSTSETVPRDCFAKEFQSTAKCSQYCSHSKHGKTKRYSIIENNPLIYRSSVISGENPDVLESFGSASSLDVKVNF